MIIEDLDALKSWLSKTLEPICDADPSALAKYVAALLKKDKKETELKVLCIDQLDVFLQKETQGFVDKLFEAVNTRSYLPQFEQPLPTARTDAAQCQDKGDVKNELQPNREDERDRRFTRIATRSPPQCSSRYRDDRRVDDRKKEDRNRRRNHDRTPLRRDSYWERYGRRQGLRCSWSNDHPRVRDRDGDESRTRSRSSSRAKSKERDSGKAKHDQEGRERPEPVETYTPAPSVPDLSLSLFPIPVPCLGSAITVVVPKQHGGSNAEGWSPFAQEQQLCQSSAGPQLRKRCCDYDEKGFCMRGDLCPFDHGSDPVVVDDVTLPGILPFQTQPLPMIDSQPTPGLPPPQSLVTPRPPLNLRPIVPPPCSLPPSLPPVAGPPPPLPPLQPSGMDAPPNSITSSVPNIVPSKMCVRPPQVPLPLFSRGTYDMDVYNPESPSLSRPMYRHRAQVQRPNLIGLTAGDMDLPHEKSVGSGSVRIVVESNRRKRTLDPQDGAVLAKKPWFNKTIKPNHQGFNRRVPFGSGNAKLYIRQIPAELNNISKLNEHFSKFGTIVNLQVAYQNDPMSALVQFASHEQARRAMVSTEAVLNNRFIKVHWYREDIAVPTQLPAVLQSTHKPPSAAKLSVKDRLGPRPSTHPENPRQSQNAEKMLVRNRLGFPSKAAAGGPVFAPSAGLSTTVYGPREVKGEQKVTPFLSLASSTETLRKRQEALKLQQDVRKKKQEILEKHIETQKLLILKLEKNRTIKCEDKAVIMETLTTLTNKIMQLQADMKAASSGNSLKPIKTKTQAQKELLDAELDLYKKMQAGEDVTQLRVKYTQLQLEAAKRGVLGTGRVTMGVGAWGRGLPHGRGRGERGARGRGRGPPMHAVIDHRPRALDVLGFTDSDRVDLLPHFAQFGAIEDCHIDESTDHAVITYKTRTEAEAAAVHGGKLNGQKLKLAWHKPTKALTPTDAEEVEPEDEDFQEETPTDNAVLQDDDEEDDDNEPRSWRR